jgi:hypothetical protein
MESEDIQKSDEINLCNRGFTATIAVFQHMQTIIVGGRIGGKERKSFPG